MYEIVTLNSQPEMEFYYNKNSKMNIFLGNSRKFSEQVFYRTARDGTAAFDVTQKIITTENSFSRRSFIKVNLIYSTSSSEM